MIVRPIEHILDLNCGSAPRSEGIHVSQVLASIARNMGLWEDDEEYEPYKLDECISLEASNRMALGLAWEEWLSKQLEAIYPDFLYHFGELERDGIFLTADGYRLSYLDGVGPPVTHEFKCTWKSARPEMRPIDGEWYWLCQLKAYCHALESKLGWMHIYYVNGEYRGGFKPVYRAYELEFTATEIQKNWDMILKEADRMRNNKTGGLVYWQEEEGEYR